MLQNKSTLIILVSIVVIFLLSFFALRPILSTLRQSNLEVGAKKIEYKRKSEKLANLKKIQDKISQSKEQIDLMKKALPKGVDMPSLLVNIEGLISASGLSLSSLSPVQTTETPTPEEIASTTEVPSAPVSQVVTEVTGISTASFSLSLSGSYPPLLTLINNLEKNLRPMTISTLNLVSGGAADKPMSATINVNTFYVK